MILFFKAITRFSTKLLYFVYCCLVANPLYTLIEQFQLIFIFYYKFFPYIYLQLQNQLCLSFLYISTIQYTLGMLKNINQSLLRFWFSKQVRVRYAPSPTGPMHLGAVRTALINYMYAVKNDGKFILRIEDTDTQRNVQNGAQHIFNTLSWLGIMPHESYKTKKAKFGPYIQSERIQIYRKIWQQLLRNGLAYPCFCTQHQKVKDSKSYDGRCRKLSLQQVKNKIKSGQKYAIRIKSDVTQFIQNSFMDENYGEVSASPFDDFIIVKSNGLPTYHLANVIDDWKMNISHIIRGAQWLTNTPKHIYLYKVLGVTPPKFLHLPLLFTAQGKKLSKRDPTAPVDHLKAQGYLPQAIINYTGLLGYKQDKQGKNKFLTLSKLTEMFDAKNLTNVPIKSDTKKLNFYNRHYMRQKYRDKDQKYIKDLRKYLRYSHNLIEQQYNDQYLDKVLQCVIERVNKPSDFKQFTFFFQQPKWSNQQTLKDIQKLFGSKCEASYNQHQSRIAIIGEDPALYQKNKIILHNLLLIFDHVIPEQEYNELKINQKISQFLYDHTSTIKNQDLFHLLRVAVIGRKSGPNIVGICELFGRERVLKGLNKLKSIYE